MPLRRVSPADIELAIAVALQELLKTDVTVTVDRIEFSTSNENGSARAANVVLTVSAPANPS